MEVIEKMKIQMMERQIQNQIQNQNQKQNQNQGKLKLMEVIEKMTILVMMTPLVQDRMKLKEAVIEVLNQITIQAMLILMVEPVIKVLN